MSSFCYAELPSKLNQIQYNEMIDQYTAQVNETKKVLDAPDVQADAIQQKQAFCSRLNAYEHIEKISANNIELENAKMMRVIAQHYLDHQRQRLIDSGMTEQVFCAVTP